MKSLFFILVRPRSLDEDSRRREFILNVILLGIISLAAVALVASIISIFTSGGDDKAIPIFVMVALLLSFGFLYLLSRVGHYKVSSFLLIAAILLPTIKVSLSFGFELPQAVLTFAMVIVFAGVLIGTRAAFITAGMICLFLLVVSYFQGTDILPINSSWRGERARLGDGVVFAFTLFNIAIVSWLSNRDIERSLNRARNSEKELKKERDLLEIRVKERTKELEVSQQEKITQLSRFAEFGRASSSVFHDLVTPLTVLSLHLHELKKMDPEESKALKNHIQKSIKAYKKMEDYIDVVRHKLQQQEVKKIFKVDDEIDQVIKLVQYKAKKNGVELTFEKVGNYFQTYGDPVKFNKVIMNLINNAIDAYDDISDLKKVVSIKIAQKGPDMMVAVSDWGPGIRKSEAENIFKPFYTTKDPDKGIGIGLSICKEIIENDFKGKISFESKDNGTVFKVEFPKIKKNKND